MKTKYIFLIILLIIALTNCVQQQKEPSNSIKIKPQPPVFQSMQTEFTDKEILDAVYSDYKVPNDFFKDVLETDNISYSVYYLNVMKNNESAFYCTNDFNTAKQLVEKDIVEYNQKNNWDRILRETSETEKFFEFKTILDQTRFPDKYLRYRVYKCSYVTDLQYIRFYPHDDYSTGIYIGILEQKPITKENVKEFVEFQWYSIFNNYNSHGKKVLSSFEEMDDNSIKHTFFETKTVGGDWGTCDEITLIKSDYTINKNSGEIKLFQNDLRKIKGNCQ
ncbi:hypothetical protein HOD20_10330 [archaeon]|jgi:hypothetical protein|nr:hypothetical protein [archaeon]MBT4352906.1 hypothetical protein [archaeon]MBT4648462.1 hypothetical protein [archaeon]MBT6821729.1 hypothetical protein [archaeon]